MTRFPGLPDIEPPRVDPLPHVVAALDDLADYEQGLLYDLRAVAARREEMMRGAVTYLNMHSGTWRVDIATQATREPRWRLYHVKDPDSYLHVFSPERALRTVARWIEEDRQP